MADMPSTQVPQNDEFTFESAANKEFPLAPEGVHKVKVVRALFSMRENTFKPEAGKQPTVQLMIQSDQQYKPEGSTEVKNYNLFKTMKISDHEKSAMFEFFRDVLGTTVPLNDQKKIVLARKIEKVEDGEDRVHLPQFEDLEFSVVVKHEKKDDGKIRDFIDTVLASPEQKASNALLFSSPQA